MCSLPDLNLTATTKDTNAHSRQQVVGGIRVLVDTTVEDCSSILANGRRDESLATRVVLDEVGHVVDNTGNSNEALAILGLSNVIIPVNNGELLKRYTPIKLRSLLVELLLDLLETALLNLVLSELLEVRGEAELLPCPDSPLGRVILPPLNSVAVVRRELVVEVVVSLTKSDESSDDVISGRVAVVKGLVAEPVGKRVDTEGSLLDEADAENTSVDKSTHPVTPA